MTAVAAPAAGATSAPVAPSNGATSQAETPTSGSPKPPATGEATQTKAPEQPWKVKRKLKVGGKEVEREYDDRRLQILEHTASQKAETERQQAEFQARMRRLEEDPDGFFQEAGVDIEAILAARQQRAEQMKTLSPEQRELLAAREELNKLKTAQQKQAEQAQRYAEAREQTEFVQGNARLFGQTMKLAGIETGSAFDKGSYLASMSAVRRMALVNGEPDLTPEQLMAHTERFEQKQFANTVARKLKNPEWRAKNADALKELAAAVFPALEGDALTDFVGKANALRIVKAVHAKTRTSPVPVIQEPAPVGVQTHGAPPTGKLRDEWDVLDGLSG